MLTSSKTPASLLARGGRAGRPFANVWSHVTKSYHQCKNNNGQFANVTRAQFSGATKAQITDDNLTHQYQNHHYQWAKKEKVLASSGLALLGLACAYHFTSGSSEDSVMSASCKSENGAGSNGTASNSRLSGSNSSFREEAVIFAGNSNKELAERICHHLETDLGQLKCTRFADGEVALQFLDSTRGKDVYIIQPTCPPVNENLMELLLMVSTCRRASAKKITAVVPYYGYARQDRKLSSRVPISAADVARMIEVMGVDRVIAVDLHCGQIQGFFSPRIPVDNLEAQPVGLQYFKSKPLNNVIIVSPDAGGVYRARKFQEGLAAEGFNPGLAMIIKQRSRPNEVEKMELVGTVNGSDVIIVDDMIDTAGTLCEAARELKKHGAKTIYAFATHGLFSGPAIERILASPLEEVVVTDSVRTTQPVEACPKITQLTIGGLLAAAIRRIHNKESLHMLFKAPEVLG